MDKYPDVMKLQALNERIKLFSQEHAYRNETSFTKRLESILGNDVDGLEKVHKVLDLIEETCSKCYDGPVRCNCSNDE